MMAPKLNLAQAQAKAPASETSSVNLPEQLHKRSQAFNAIVFENVRIGTMHKEVERIVVQCQEPVSDMRLEVKWIGDEEVLVLPAPNSLLPPQVENELKNTLYPLRRELISKSICDGCRLCWVNQHGMVAYKEGEGKTKWVPSMVAQQTVVPVANSFAVLS